MSQKASVEERLDSLEAENKGLRHEMERLQAVQEIHNLMGRYEFLHTAGRNDETLELFAMNTPGVRAARGAWGIFDGPEGIKRLYSTVHNYIRTGASNPGKENGAGVLIMQHLTTPVIEVAGDGQTAKGIWVSPGVWTGKQGEKMQAMWTLCKYSIDFVKEDGKWKIWHKHVHGIIMTPYEKSWVDDAYDPFVNPLPDELSPDRPNPGAREYSKELPMELNPVPPEPYETWDESKACVK
ncbi:nuclear transport factor 2 family protein [Chloroflexota bacterium]